MMIVCNTLKHQVTPIHSTVIVLYSQLLGHTSFDSFWSKNFWLHTLQESLNVALHNTHCDGTFAHHSVSISLNTGLWPRDMNCLEYVIPGWCTTITPRLECGATRRRPDDDTGLDSLLILLYFSLSYICFKLLMVQSCKFVIFN